MIELISHRSSSSPSSHCHQILHHEVEKPIHRAAGGTLRETWGILILESIHVNRYEQIQVNSTCTLDSCTFQRFMTSPLLEKKTCLASTCLSSATNANWFMASKGCRLGFLLIHLKGWIKPSQLLWTGFPPSTVNRSASCVLSTTLRQVPGTTSFRLVIAVLVPWTV